MKKIALPLLSFLAIACSSDSDEINDETVNNAPSIVSQQFQIAEHSSAGTVIGTITATDKEEDELTFSIASSEDISINENTGEIIIGEDLKLDFETVNNIEFTVSVFDGTTISDATIILNIEDINEFDVLSEAQKDIVAHFKHLTLFQDTTSPTQDIMRKWDEPMKLFLVGDFPEAARNMVQEVITDYNMLASSGDFNITFVTVESEANAQLFFGTKEETETVFPALYEQIKNLTVDGYATASFVGNFYKTAQIWISKETDALFRHELGHALGLGHSNLCGDDNPSAMCSTIKPQSQLLEIEQNVINYFYHEDMPSGLNLQQIEEQLSNLILLEE